jgi:hypothetical protein
MPFSGHNVLSIFYQGLAAREPLLAALIHEDIISVSLTAATGMVSYGQETADRLQNSCKDLPVKDRLMLNQALSDLGYSVSWL